MPVLLSPVSFKMIKDYQKDKISEEFSAFSYKNGTAIEFRAISETKNRLVFNMNLKNVIL